MQLRVAGGQDSPVDREQVRHKRQLDRRPARHMGQALLHLRRVPVRRHFIGGEAFVELRIVGVLGQLAAAPVTPDLQSAMIPSAAIYPLRSAGANASGTAVV